MAVASRPPRPGAKRTGSGSGGTARATGKSGTGAKSGAAGKSGASGQSGAAGKSGTAKPVRKPAARPVTRGLAHGPAPRSRATVSTTSAQRFAARVRARRRRRWLVLVVVLFVLVGGVWGVLKSPWATVSRIEVSGTHRVTAASVRAEAEPELGHPMLLARTADIAARVGGQRLVRSVTVKRHWPSTLRISVVERVPVAAVPNGSQLALVDPDGVVIEQVEAAQVPSGLPLIQVSPGVGDAGALRGCLAVLHGLPSSLKKRLQSIGADSTDGIWLKLTGGERVEWGSSDDTPRKARVLTALLRQHAVEYDVRSPGTPAVGPQK
jgi:cell division protein FtsQ